MAFSAFVCWPVYAIGKKVIRKNGVGAASAWFWAFLPDGIFYSVIWVWDTALAALCMTLLFAATLQIRGRTKLSWWVGYGALWAFGAMVNPSVLSVLPFLALWALWPLRQELARGCQAGAGRRGNFCRWHHAMDRSQLCGVSQVHSTAIELRTWSYG